ncbi:hypothetical protein [Streptomyces sp. NPDC002785]|uniref:hypothetical protein n=1 Tax=Streptomyces sp. NPDC002785 TaxID=3154543 RepID=UPI00331D9BCB
MESPERHVLGLARDAVVFTTITKGRAGRLPGDNNWRQQTWWPTVADHYCFLAAVAEERTRAVADEARTVGDDVLRVGVETAA